MSLHQKCKLLGRRNIRRFSGAMKSTGMNPMLCSTGKIDFANGVIRVGAETQLWSGTKRRFSYTVHRPTDLLCHGNGNGTSIDLLCFLDDQYSKTCHHHSRRSLRLSLHVPDHGRPLYKNRYPECHG